MWWKDFLWGFWNGLTSWIVLIAHVFGMLQSQPVYDHLRPSNWYAFGFLLGIGGLGGGAGSSSDYGDECRSMIWSTFV